MDKDRRFAVLIDADNVSDKYIRLILDELSNDGIITYKRIYGDWTRPALGSWKNVLLDYSITPIQQYGYTTGKNATDSAMIIDAMDILYTGNVEGFCIVSSDSDFTRLASRLREAGKFVIGMGERKTPAAFVAACNRFTYLEVLAQQPADEEDVPLLEPVAGEDRMALPAIKAAILAIAEETSDDEGWASVSDIGNILIKRFPDFDVRSYGFKKLTQFVDSLDLFEMRTVTGRDGSAKAVLVQALPAPPPPAPRRGRRKGR
ncbi:MAG: NYN domain-containing protein [Angelakisella sp.]|nr:NYN domain-containing protein [Angelakisella sp.]